MPRALRIFGNRLSTAWRLRKFTGRSVNGQLGTVVYRGLGFKAAELAGVSFESFVTLDDAVRGKFLEEAKKLVKSERIRPGSNTVTDAGVAFLVDDWDGGTTDITNFNWHAMGTGGSPPGTPAVTVTALVTPVESRVAGVKSQPAANQIRSVATITATAPRTINEWGLFSASTAGTVWSARWFTAIVLDTSDAIEFTYTLTVSSFTA